MIKSHRTLLVLFAAIIGLSGTIEPSIAADRKTIVVGTAPVGSMTFPPMIGVAAIVNKYVPNLALSPQETGGSEVNIRLLSQGKIQLGIFAMESAVEAVNGRPPFGKKLNVNVLFRLFQQGVIWFGRKDAGVKSWNDLEGKKIIAGAPSGSTGMIGNMVAKITGMDKKADIKLLPPNAMLNLLSDGTVDAGYGLIAGSVTSSQVKEAMTTIKLNFFGVDDATITKVEEMMPGVTKVKYHPDFIPGQGAITTIGDILVIGASPDMSEEDAYNIVKSVYEHYDQLGKFSPTVKGAKPESMVFGLPEGVSFHPGAARYYREKGLLK